MATVTFDGPNKLIKGLTGITEHDVQIDWYSDWKEWFRLSDNAKYLPAMRSIGGDEITAEQTAGDTYFLSNGWKFEPFPEDNNIVVIGNVYVDNIATYGANRWVPPAGTWQIGVEFNVSNLVDSSIAQSPELQHSSFNGGVTIDVIYGDSGTDYPLGTGEYPVDNIPDAVLIASSRGFGKLFVIGDITIGATHDIEGYEIIGESQRKTSITVQAAALTSGAEFYNSTIVTGSEFDGEIDFYGCRIQTILYVRAEMKDCDLQGTVTLVNSGITRLKDCRSDVAGSSTPKINANNTGQDLSIRNYSGGLEIENSTGNISVDLISGHIVLAPTVTAGDIVIRGVGKVTDNSVGATVDSDNLIRAEAIWNFDLSGSAYEIDVTKAGTLLNQNNILLISRLLVDDGVSKMTVYKRDGLTPLIEWEQKDKDGNSIVLQGTGPTERKAPVYP